VTAGRVGSPNLQRQAAVICLVCLFSLASAEPSAAFDLSGTAVVFWGTSDTLQSSTDSVDQRYAFNLGQDLTEFLRVGVSYQHFDFATRPDGGTTGRERRRTPRLFLAYDRPSLSADVRWETTQSDGTSNIENFDISRFSGGLLWEPRGDFSLSARFSDTTNVADVGALGRDTRQQAVAVQARYQRTFWRTSYLFTRSELDNRANDFSSLQERHEGRIAAARGFFDDRLRLGFGGSISNLDGRQKVGADTDLAEPVVAADGLFTITLTPEIGELDSAPGLNDGDFETPAEGGIDIGGANTFRNLGLDLGIIRPITRLEISVDRPSGSTVVWAVFKSADNLLWEEVPVTFSAYDAGIRRYSVRFAETSERFFKVVNISVNPEPIVLVTEVRALRDVETIDEESARERRLYSANVSARYRTLGGRFDAEATAGGRNDENFVAGLIRRDYSQRYHTARLGLRLADDLHARTGYRYAESENLEGAEFFRESEIVDAGLVWTPLRTIRADLSLQRRTESERDAELRTTESAAFNLLTELLPDLTLTSSLLYSRLLEPGGQEDRSSWTWSEAVRTRPISQLTLDGFLSYSRIATKATDRRFDRSSARLVSTWRVTSFINVRGEWGWSETDNVSTVRQRYGTGYAPGPKLYFSLNYDRFSSDAGRKTSAQSIGGQYQLQQKFRLIASASRSETSFDGDLTIRNDNLRVGFNLFF
jgi:hypothetical protein